MITYKDCPECEALRAAYERGVAETHDGFNCCGGNDNTPREHTSDCPRYAWREHFDALQAERDELQAKLDALVKAAFLARNAWYCEGDGFSRHDVPTRKEARRDHLPGLSLLRCRAHPLHGRQVLGVRNCVEVIEAALKPRKKEGAGKAGAP